MNSFANFIKSLRQTATKVVVVGNESADMDSIVSSLALSYLLTHQNNTPALPLINTTRSDMRLRPDCQCLLEDLLDYLTFVDEYTITKEKLWLVDHNAPASRQSHWEPQVYGIIDHHQDEHKCQGALVRQIEPVGSCATLVAQRIREAGITVDHTLASLLLAPILLDTTNLSPSAGKATPLDIEYVQWLGSNVNWSTSFVSTESMYETLHKLKTKVKHLSAPDLLRKDYKQWQLQDPLGQDWMVGISSVGYPLDKWIQRDGLQVIHQALEEYRHSLGLDLLLVMTHGKSQKIYGRQLMVKFAPDNPQHRVIEGLLASDTLELKQREPGVFSQLNCQASRKQVFPVVKNIIEQYVN